MIKYLRTNDEKCVGCMTCTAVCSKLYFKEENPAKSDIQVQDLGGGKYHLVACDQECRKCVAECPTQAITVAKTGVVMIDRKLCVGCLACVAVCPIGGISNTYSYLARASTALSVTLTGVSSLLSVVTIPIITGWFEGVVGHPLGFRAPHADASHLPDLISPAWKAPTSGGSTGRPKLIVSGDPASLDTDAPPPLLLGTDGCLVMPGPLYHNGPGVWSCQALLAGNHVALLQRFDDLALDARPIA